MKKFIWCTTCTSNVDSHPFNQLLCTALVLSTLIFSAEKVKRQDGVYAASTDVITNNRQTRSTTATTDCIVILLCVSLWQRAGGCVHHWAGGRPRTLLHPPRLVFTCVSLRVSYNTVYTRVASVTRPPKMHDVSHFRCSLFHACVEM